jgi:pilus assembly protein CpaE
VSIEVSIIGAATRDLADLLRSTHLTATSAPVADLLRIAQPGARPPRVIVLDLRQHPELPAALSLLRKEHPSTGVVIVASKLDPNLMLEAMRAGVTEWVVDPVHESDLCAAVERASGTAPGAPAGEVFAVVGAKGGVGATTVAVNVATTLSMVAKASTLLIDLHPACGDAALFLGAEPNFSIVDALENTHRLDEAFLKGIVVKTSAGPDLLASPDRAVPNAVDCRRVRAVVEAAARCYRFVVLDVPRADPGIEEALSLASSITVVATQELAAIRAASRMADRLRQRYGRERVPIVVNRYDRAAEIDAEDLERAVGGRIGHKFPSNYRLAIEALNKGRPVVVDNHNKLASSLAAYARALSGLTVPEPGDAHKSTGLFGRFTGRR